MAVNGFFFSNTVSLPPEIVTHVLSYVPPCQLVNKCSQVCKNWNYNINNNAMCLAIAEMQRSERKCLSNLNVNEQSNLGFSWIVLYQICLKEPLEQNFLRNNCGQNELEYWRVNAPRHDYHSQKSAWWIENYPLGADSLPECEDFVGSTSCFSTSYRNCEKEQLIDLRERGISECVMDELQPTIIASEWYAGRYDCGCLYVLTVSLLNEEKEIIIEKKEYRKVVEGLGRKWEKVIIEFENYGPGVRFILFKHFGKDTKYWADQFGSKMSGGVVKLSLLGLTNRILTNLSVTERKKLRFPWLVLYQICLNNPFEQNFLRNNCGQNKLEHWQIISPRHDYYNQRSAWWIENSPLGADPLPECEDFVGITSCFSTSYQNCEKEQLIDLCKEGIFECVMDELQPKIIASEWYAGRYDCGSLYELTVTLLNEEKEIIIEKKEKRKVEEGFGRKWEKVIIEFENYGPGVRFILFNHFGRDIKFWADQYGSKMSGGAVKLSLLELTDRN